MDGNNVKPSREVDEGDEIEVQQGIIRKRLKVLKPAKNRVAAKLVPELAEDLTPKEEYEKQELLRQFNHEKRDRGAGRPTKKERRDIGKLKGEDN